MSLVRSMVRDGDHVEVYADQPLDESGVTLVEAFLADWRDMLGEVGIYAIRIDARGTTFRGGSG